MPLVHLLEAAEAQSQVEEAKIEINNLNIVIQNLKDLGQRIKEKLQRLKEDVIEFVPNMAVKLFKAFKQKVLSDEDAQKAATKEITKISMPVIKLVADADEQIAKLNKIEISEAELKIALDDWFNKDKYLPEISKRDEIDEKLFMSNNERAMRAIKVSIADRDNDLGIEDDGDLDR